jgi:hypothetical protein
MWQKYCPVFVATNGNRMAYVVEEQRWQPLPPTSGLSEEFINNIEFFVEGSLQCTSCEKQSGRVFLMNILTGAFIG